MNITEKKEVLLDIVKEADEKLTRLLIALANEYNSSEEYTNEEMEGFYKVRDEFINHPETGRTAEEAHHLIRNNKRK